MNEAERAAVIAEAAEAIRGFDALYVGALAVIAAHVVEKTGDISAVQSLVTPEPASPSASIMDAKFGDLAQLAAQADAMTQAWALVRQWVLPNDPVRLGDRLKTVPADVAEAITGHLRDAHLLHD